MDCFNDMISLTIKKLIISMIKNLLFRFIAILFVLGFCSYKALSQKFTFAIMPDTQVEVGANSDMYFSRMRWIVKNRERIPFVFHVGDLVNFNNNVHWDNASNGYDTLDNYNIKYAISAGNHDTGAVGEFSGSAAPGDVHANLRNTEKYNRYFPPSRFKAIRGTYEQGKSENSFHTFTTGKLKWLVITLEFCSRKGPVLWADSVVAQHPAYNVIIQTHYHLTPKGEINTNNAGYGDLSPAEIYNMFIKKHKNIVLVLSGHVCSSAYRKDIGDNGNEIHQILQDYQCEDMGGGYIRLLDVNVDTGEIDAKMYSPYYKKYKSDTSAFVIKNVKFIK